MSDRRTEQPEEELLNRLIDEAEQGTAPAAETTVLPPITPSGTSANGGLNGLLGGLLSNPALLSALPQLINSLGRLSAVHPTSGDEATTSADTPKAEPADENVGAAPMKKGSVDRHTALLCALKPYLGSERRQAAEYLLGLCRLWDTLRGMGINLPALLSAGQSETTEDHKEV